MKRFDPSQLAAFLAVAEHRSFRRAAIALDVTPSALSHALRAIEQRLDVRLVNRTTRSVSLTEAGERLFRRISPAFKDIQDAVEDLNEFRDQPFGTIRLNAARQAAHLVLLPLVGRFVKHYPDIRVEIVIDNTVADIVAAGFDAGVRLGELVAADMIAVPIGGSQRSAIVGTADYFRQYGRPETPRDLHRFPCVRYRFLSGMLYRWEFEREGLALDVDVDGPVTLSEQDLMVDAALDGIGLAYVFERQVRALLAEGRLVRVLESWCPEYAGFFLYFPSRRQMPSALRAFIDFARRENREADCS